MPDVQYRVMVNDGTGNDIDKTFLHSASDSVLAEAASEAGTCAFLKTISDTYHTRILRETPWRCRSCHAKATELVSRPFCGLPKLIIANRLVPTCHRTECLHDALRHLDEMEGYISETLQKAVGKTLPDVMDTHRCCANCHALTRVKACSQCKRTAYCSRECQRKHWPHHKIICRYLAAQLA